MNHLTFSRAVVEGYSKKFFRFRGRAFREELGWMKLLEGIATIVFALSAFYFVTGVPDIFLWIFCVGFVFTLALGIPQISVAVRRLHDSGRSGWFWWVQLVPLAGSFVWWYLLSLPSQYGSNQYGEQPPETRGQVQMPGGLRAEIKEAWRKWLRGGCYRLQGRASRSEFWWLVWTIVIGLYVLIYLAQLFMPIEWKFKLLSEYGIYSVLFYYVVLLAALNLFGWATCVRRLHDAGYSGYYSWLMWIPVLGHFILAYQTAQPTQVGENQYGAQPPETIPVYSTETVLPATN